MISAALACLSLAVYFEARSEPIAGQVAVAQVVLNRVENSRFPGTVCEVVYQYRQFSFYWDGKSDTPREQLAWQQAQLVAGAVMAGSVHASLTRSLFYHADYVQPRWADGMAHVATYGEHHFYE